MQLTLNGLMVLVLQESLHNNSSNYTEKADALAIYVTSITNSNATSNSNNTLTIKQINEIVGSLKNDKYLVDDLTGDSYTVNTNDAILIITRPNREPNGTLIIGAAFQDDIGGRVVNTSNRNNVTNSSLSTAVIVTIESLNYVKSFNVFIINDPTPFQDVDNTSNRTLSSSIVFAIIQGADMNRRNITIDLFFQVLKPPKPTE
ncbi:unnamed protein product, partial [Rotaria sp. Silwood2]